MPINTGKLLSLPNSNILKYKWIKNSYKSSRLDKCLKNEYNILHIFINRGCGEKISWAIKLFD